MALQTEFRVAVACALLAAHITLSGPVTAQDSILDRAEYLRERARQATSGVLGCGFATITIDTSRGRVTRRTSADPVLVFGPSVTMSDLLVLLRARLEANARGWGPMGEDAESLCYVTLITVALSEDPTAVAVIAPLLADPSGVVRRHAAYALKELACSSEELHRMVAEAVWEQTENGVTVPDDVLP